MSAVPHLSKQFRDLSQRPLGGFRVEVGSDLFTWTVWFSGPKDTLYFPGQYKAQLTFPQDFPYKPPEMRILSSFWHPNVYEDGRVCISILHAPGVDEQNSLETAQMRWTPVQSIEKVLISVVSLLADPDASDAGAPANVEALSEYRKNRPKYIQRCKEFAEKSLRELPPTWAAIPEQDAPPEVVRCISTFTDEVFTAGEDDGGEDEEEEEDVSASPPKTASPAATASASGGGSGQYSSELQQLRGMGIGGAKTDAQLLEMLVKAKGDISTVIDRLC